jgi:hypothetical protein
MIALAVLGRLSSAGYFDRPEIREHLRSDTDFDSLRSQEAFRRLLAEPKATAKHQAKP